MPKIALCGRGGSGKSTLASLLARYLAASGQKVLVVDADESNRRLHGMLGLPRPPMSLMEDLGGKMALKKGLLSTLSHGDSAAAEELLAPLFRIEDFPPSVVSIRDCLALVEIGKIERPDEGCACPMGVLGKEFLERLDARTWWVLVDLEAGIEYLGRGIYAGCEAFCLVLEPSAESLDLGCRMREIARQVDRSLTIVAGRCPEPLREAFLGALEAEGLSGRIVLPDLPAIAEANLGGVPVPLVPQVLPPLRELTEELAEAVRGS